MSDIVKRLAKCAAVSEIIKDNPKIYYDAMYEIERLRTENEKLREALSAERERCARIVEIHAKAVDGDKIAAAIRESGDELLN